MNHKDLINALSKKHGFTDYLSDKVIKTILGSVVAALKQGKLVRLRGFGTFSVIPISTKRYRDPRTGKIRTKTIKNKVKFKPSGNMLT